MGRKGRDWVRVKDLALFLVSIESRENAGFGVVLHTQLTLGSRNLHQTPSSRTSCILLHRLRKTASMRLRNSIMPTSSFAFIGLAT